MEYNDFEKKLMNLTPVDPELDPASAAFEAGYRRGCRKSRIWQLGGGCMTILVVLLSVYIIADSRVRSQSELDNVIQLAKADVADTGLARIKFEHSCVDKPVKELDKNSYLLLRRRVLEEGLDALPESSGQKGRVYTIVDTINI